VAGPTPQAAAAIGESVASGDGLVLTDISVAGPDDAQTDFLDIAMLVGAAGNPQAGQLRVGFRFAVDQLLTVPPLNPVRPASIRAVQRVR
jgi:hypothetical protein